MQPGPLATERFQFIRSLGHGATSRVFEVEDRTHGGRFALKQLRHERLSAERTSRFKDEFRALERISHPSVAKVYELLADEQGIYLLMELVEGVDFISYVRPGSRALITETETETRAVRTRVEASAGVVLDVERLRAALTQLSDGLRAVHASGSIHCDVKPENVLVTHAGRVVIVDFGLVTTEAVHDTHSRGTPAFMAPEQFAGTYTEASDWYAVGMMLYEALCGRCWPEGSPRSIARTRSASRPPDPRFQSGPLPDDLVELALRLLEPDPARRPGSELIARIVGSDANLAPVQRLDSAFFGRAAELDQLRAAFGDARRGHAHVVHLHGESGIGKTSLLRQFTREVQEHGVVVFRGACYRDASVPYKALDTIMDRIAVNLGRLELSIDGADRAALALMFPVFRVASNEAEEPAVVEHDPLLIRARAVLAFRKLLVELAAQRGIVLCIDDMQWTDLESIELLANLMHPPAPAGLLLVLGYRSSPGGWRGRTQVVREKLPCHCDIALGPLDAEAVRALVGTSAAVDQEAIEAILRESAGNPFFVGELVRVGSAGRGSEAITLGSVLAARMSALAPQHRPYLELVSVSGRPVDERVLRRALRSSQEALLETRRVLVAESLVRISEEEGRPVEPYHDRIREHLLRELTPGRLRDRHRALAEAYEVEGADDPEILALHYRAADEREKAFVYAERAGDTAAAALAFGRAADLYDMALQLGTDGARPSLLVKHGQAASHAARAAEAASSFAAALEYAPNDLELKLRAGEEWVRAGDIERGLAFFSEVAQTIGWRIPKRPSMALLSLLWHELQLRRSGMRISPREVGAQEQQRLTICLTIARQVIIVDPLLGSLCQHRHLHMALSAGSRIDLVYALAIESGFFANLSLIANAIPRAEEFCRLAHELSEPSDPPLTHGLLRSTRGMIALAKGDLASCRAAQEQAVEIYRGKQGVNLRWEVAFCQNLSIALLALDGDFPAMRQRMQPYALEAAGYPLLETMHAHWCAARLALCDDDPQEARRIVAATMARWPAAPWRVQHFTALLALGDIGLYADDLQGTWRYLKSAWRRSRNAGFHLVSVYLGLALLLRARLALALGLSREAQRDIRALLRRPESSFRALGRALQACWHAARGERLRAISLLESAIPHLIEHGVGLFAIAARQRCAALIGDRASEQAALDTLRGRGVRAPERLIESLLPLPTAVPSRA